MKLAWRIESLIILVVCVCLISLLEAFSTSKLLHQRPITHHSRWCTSTSPKSYYTDRLSNNHNIDDELSSYCRIVHRTPTCTYAVFQDDDCEDLCSDFGEDFSAPTASLEVPTPTKEKVKSVISHTMPSPKSRKTRALWWTDPTGLTECKSCHGDGDQICRFCGGTDFLSAIGGETDALFYEGIGKDCPVCNDGKETCHECAGTGYIFSWTQSLAKNQTTSMHP